MHDIYGLQNICFFFNVYIDANPGHPHHEEGLQVGERGNGATLIHQDTKPKVQALLQCLRKKRWKSKNLNLL